MGQLLCTSNPGFLWNCRIAEQLNCLAEPASGLCSEPCHRDLSLLIYLHFATTFTNKQKTNPFLKSESDRKWQAGSDGEQWPLKCLLICNIQHGIKLVQIRNTVLCRYRVTYLKFCFSSQNSLISKDCLIIPKNCLIIPSCF